MKTAKTIYLIVIITLTVLIVGFFGARRIHAFGDFFSDVNIKKDSATVEPFKEIKLDADIANFTILEGDDYHVDYEYPDNMVLKGKVENEVLKIELKGKSGQSFGLFRIGKTGIKTAEPKITVYVPKGTELEKMSLTIDAGNINLADRFIGDIQMDCDAANVILQGITSNKVGLKADAGNIEIQDSTLGDCDFDTSAGRIDVDNTVMNSTEVKSDMGEINMDSVTFSKGKVDSEMGSVSVDGIFEELTSHTSMGKISVSGDSVEEAKLDLRVDMGEVSVNGSSRGSSYIKK